jgi:nucleoside-diphosphate-sugar epimerase
MYVVGCGTLGCRVAKEFITRSNGVYGEVTATSSRIDSLKALGVTPVLGREGRLQLLSIPRLIVYCIPPSALGDAYANHIEQAMNDFQCDETKDDWRFVFTSSTSMYVNSVEGINIVDEETKVDYDKLSASAKRLVDAENVVLKRGGTVLRFSGLYEKERGFHNYYLSGKAGATISGAFRLQLVNQVHYDDAKNAVLAVLNHDDRNQVAGNIFTISDDEPMTKEDIISCAKQIYTASGKEFADVQFQDSKGLNEPSGKKVNSLKAKDVLGWKPQFKSFREFAEASVSQPSQL